MKKTVLISAVSVLLTFPLLASAHNACSSEDPDHCAYWHDSSDSYVKDGSGNCVRTASWTLDAQVEGCSAPMPEPVELDSDGDGVMDGSDQCPNTPSGAAVDAVGCPLDTDGDGVFDHRDQCAATPAGTAVDAVGCPLDSDSDGVLDNADQCPATPAGVKVDSKGCEVPQFKTVSVNLDVKFASNSADVEAAYATQMEALAYVLKASASSQVTINGHTDSAGSAAYNQSLSQRRADAVAEYMVEKYDVNASQVRAVGHGESSPVADNSTSEGRHQNRRVVAEISAKVKR